MNILTISNHWHYYTTHYIMIHVTYIHSESHHIANHTGDKSKAFTTGVPQEEKFV